MELQHACKELSSKDEQLLHLQAKVSSLEKELVLKAQKSQDRGDDVDTQAVPAAVNALATRLRGSTPLPQSLEKEKIEQTQTSSDPVASMEYMTTTSMLSDVYTPKNVNPLPAISQQRGLGPLPPLL